MDKIDVSPEYWDARFQGLPKSRVLSRLREELEGLLD